MYANSKDEKIYKLLDIFKNLPENLQNQMIEEIIAVVQENEKTQRSYDVNE